MILTKDIERLADLNYFEIFIGVCVLMVACVGIFTLICKFSEILGKPIKWVKSNNKDHESINIIQNKQQEIENKLDALCEAMMESMCDRIEQKSKYYINEIHGIPEDEIDSFTRLYMSYRKINGNHGAEAKYNYCINHLPILPVATKIISDDE